MAAFKQDFLIEQSSDCKTLTFQDTSNFGDNDEGYTYSYFTTKTIEVFDYENQKLGATINIIDDTPVTFTLDKDRYLHIVYTLQHNANTPLVKFYNVALSCNVDLKYGEAVASELGCGCHNEELFEINKYTLTSQIFASRDNGQLSQKALDAANTVANCLSIDGDCNCK